MIRLIISLFFCVHALPALAAVHAEWDQARVAILHTPGDELFYGVIHPDAALLERAFSLSGAKKEHQAYIQKLKDEGVQVHTLRELLLKGTLDASGQPVEGPALNDLRAFAAKRLKYDISHAVQTYAKANKVTPEQAEKDLNQEVAGAKACDRSMSKFSDQYKRLCVVQALHPNELFKIIFTNPIVNLDMSSQNTDAIATYTFPQPEMNAYFMRDAMITTGKGIVLGRMNSEQRKGEPEIIRFALAKLNITPIVEVQEPGRLEGGDYIPAGDIAFQGHGLRTNYEAIRQVLAGDYYGKDTVVVVNESWKSQDQMHLDTYFNILGKGLAALVETRYQKAGGAPVEPKMRLTADIWKKNPGATDVVLEKLGPYSRVKEGIDFQTYLEQELKFKIVTVSNDDQLAYGINSLTVSDRKIFVVKGVSQKYLTDMQNAGVNANVLDFDNLKGGWGATHCTIQVIERR